MSQWPHTITILISNWPRTRKFSQLSKNTDGKRFFLTMVTHWSRSTSWLSRLPYQDVAKWNLGYTQYLRYKCNGRINQLYQKRGVGGDLSMKQPYSYTLQIHNGFPFSAVYYLVMESFIVHLHFFQCHSSWSPVSSTCSYRWASLFLLPFFSLTSSASTKQQIRFCQQPTNVKLKSFNCSRFFSFCVS